MTEELLAKMAEMAYGQIISLPIAPRWSDDGVEDVITVVKKVIEAHR